MKQNLTDEDKRGAEMSLRHFRPRCRLARLHKVCRTVYTITNPKMR